MNKKRRKINIKKFLSERIVQYSILSVFIGLANFFMLISIYANQLFNINPLIFAPIVVVAVLFLSWLIVEKWGFIKVYYKTQHGKSPIFAEIIKNQKKILKKLEKSKGVIK